LAHDCLEDALILFERKKCVGASNRFYYAYFDAVRALLATQNIWAKTHSGVQVKYAEIFVKTGVFSVETSKSLHTIFEFRQGGDYDFNHDISAEDATLCAEETQKFINLVEIYLKKEHFI
jgi:uncharacterized protein (UPF0332 family)